MIRVNRLATVQRGRFRMQHLRGRRLVAAMALAQICNLLPHVVVPAIMAQHLMPLWGLSASQAGLMASAYALGYMLVVPVLTTLTDRYDARIVLIAGSAVSGAATVAFGLFAYNLFTASILWAIAGAGFGGAYMPGLRALTDRLPAGDASRSITLYTSSFSVGVGLSFLVSQLVAAQFGWRAAFIITGIAPIAMVAVAAMLAPFKPTPAAGHPLDFRPVLKNRQTLGFIFAYGAHCMELYGIRTWIVPFWIFVAAQNGGNSIVGAITISVITAFIALPASILGNESAIRFGRHRAITIVMLTSAALALAIGLSAGFSPWLLLPLIILHGFSVSGDSGALTSGMSQSATATHRGATMAMHTTVGFLGSALGAWGTGLAIDLAGGPTASPGWLAAFTFLAVSASLGPVALLWSRKSTTLRR
jgi:predicted MFS family arabinose efflux permease